MTRNTPTWIHFGAGNIFRAFHAAILNDALNSGKYDRGVIVAESFDYEIIDKVYRPYNNLSLFVSLKSDGTVEKKDLASVTESLKADFQSVLSIDSTYSPFSERSFITTMATMDKRVEIG